MIKQEPDMIFLEGKKRKLLTFPLEAYWHGKRKKPVLTLFSTSLWRGYVATWEIKDEQLFLKEIKGKLIKPVEKSSGNRFADFLKKVFGKREVQNNIEVDLTLEELFPSEKENPVKAAWFTGNLRIEDKGATRGKKESVTYFTQEEIIITIHRGNVVLQTKSSPACCIDPYEYRIRYSKN